MELHHPNAAKTAMHLSPNDHSPMSQEIKPQKRWTLACNAVYFIASLSHKLKSLPNTRIARSLSYVALSIHDHENLPVIDQGTLTSLVNLRDLDFVSRVGGVQSLALALGTDPLFGNVVEDIVARKEAFGCNVYQKPPTKKFLSFVLEALNDTTIIILFVCAVFSLGFGIKQHGPKEGWYDGGSIIIAIFLVVFVSTFSNFRQSKQFEKLSKESSNINVEVLRDGCRKPISIFEVVVGDIVVLKTGDQVPADGLSFDSHSLKVDESSMTGETDHVEINEQNNPFLIAGTKISDGYGRMVVTSVGMNTSWGQMMSSVSQDLDEETPLQRRLNKLTSYIGKVGLLVASLVLVVLFIRYFTGHTKDESGNRKFNGKKTNTNEIMNEVISIISAAVTIVVVAIPEGLPLAVTLTLAYSMKKMMGDNAMVRKLSACETMGSATIICTDKTGTLTLNQMKVTEFWQGKESVENLLNLGNKVLELLQQAIGLNTSGSTCRVSSGSVPEVSGSPTEKAILSWAVFDLGMEMDSVSQNFEVLHVEAFNSEKKRSGVMVRKRKRMEKAVQEVHWKGAAEMILAMCSKYYDQRGMVVSMDEEDMEHFRDIIQSMAAKSLRCIAFAHKETQQLDESGLTLLGIVGLKDPCRPGVQQAVESRRKNGKA